MKPCHDNNGAAVYVGRAEAVHNPCFNDHTTAEYLNRKVYIGNCSKTFQNLLGFVHDQGQKY